MIIIRYIHEKIEIYNDDIDCIVIKNRIDGYKFICMDDKELFNTNNSSNRYNVSKLHTIKLTTYAMMLREKVLEQASKKRPYLVKDWHTGILSSSSSSSLS